MLKDIRASWLGEAVVLAALLVLVTGGCGGTGEGQDPVTVEPSAETPELSDAAVIWCDENRWQVAARASQLGLSVPPENPPQVVVSAEADETLAGLDTRIALGEISNLQAADIAERLAGELRAAAQKYASGEWAAAGVLDPDWRDWQAGEPTTYYRACAAAYELSGGPSQQSVPGGAQGTTGSVEGREAPDSGQTAAAPPSTVVAVTTTSATTTSTTPVTTSTSPPGRLVAGTVVACPDFIEATFRNTGGREVRIVETVLFIQGGDEPFGYDTSWTPTVDPGESVTWQASAYDLGMDWIAPGSVAVGARPHTSSGEFVYADGPNPHSSCSAIAPTTTTTPLQTHGVDITRSDAVCSADGAVFTFRITNTGSADLALHQVAIFPYEDDDHHFLEPEGWWPLPIVPPGQTVSLTEGFYFGDFWTGGPVELLVDSSSGQTIADIPCS